MLLEERNTILRGDMMELMSPLADVVWISPNTYGVKKHAIDTITIHCYVGNVAVEDMIRYFSNPTIKASPNYVIGEDGRIGGTLPENMASQCTSSYSNDSRAITIECASGTEHPYEINNAVYASLIRLLADICKRNKIPELKWKADKSLIGHPEEQNMTVHRWFKNKACPGDYIYSRLGQIAEQVNTKLREDAEEDMLTGKEIYERLEEYLRSLPTSKYAEEYSKQAVEAGLFKDDNNDGLLENPQGYLKREELATVLARAGLLNDKN